ncbi:hypothetical protein Acsp04_27260 [Actinomadura sp. NBRC 104425]|uniref:DUF3000 domain-containing protein n=1 Tax=Actinomadura sp. NBRC 104425 TaxID=3032204 RepID=UPI00249F9652|nr:DUF3000 domain-containing protein [Actinomadura sp. NBRC 104425]GLZ12491.1 hypothetical protein Acsp04_27260 [Actinomadura sp. NBRC 104425]
MTVPAPFRRARDTLRAILEGEPIRPELDLEDMPAPQRLAPYAAALSGSVYRDAGTDAETEVATGRLIVLYDPEGRAGWTGGFRVVAYIRADLEPEIAADELIGSVAWSWLLEALEPAGYAGVSGTVTRAVSESFGDKRGEPSTTELELRASWSPTGDDLTGHVLAWCEVMCTTAGLPPSGVSALPDRPGGSGH